MSSFKFEVADICYLVDSSEANFNDAIVQRFGSFSSNAEPDIEIRIYFMPYEILKNEGLSTGIKLYLSQNGRIIKVFLGAKRLLDMMIHFQAMLHFIMQHASCVLQRKQFLMHAGGVDYEGRGLVFTGPAETGKTTTCRNIMEANNGAIVLNDELVVIAEHADGFMIHNTPLKQDYGVLHRASVPLNSIFKLKQSETVGLSRLSPQDSINLVSSQSVPPGYQLEGLYNDTDLLGSLFARIAERVDCYELSLRPDISFWDCIKAECITN